jgi:hypothetical protein
MAGSCATRDGVQVGKPGAFVISGLEYRFVRPDMLRVEHLPTREVTFLVGSEDDLLVLLNRRYYGIGEERIRDVKALAPTFPSMHACPNGAMPSFT